ncbi:MAG: hypothetical protein HFF86_06205 [Oscillibacter sp.]|nr:hypothetical protein [Oscillibacter sp.]
MDIKVKFFEDSFVEATGPGIYGIYFQTNTENKELLYVGESVFVLVRCATHLYEIVKGDGYLGFTKEIIERNNITLAFELLLSESDKKRRKAKEKEIIKGRHPKMQSEISDRVKSIEDMIKEMTNLLNNTAPI